MNEIIATLETLRPILSSATFRQLTIIIEATLAMTGRVTMEGISRWTEKGGSYRTVQRFFEEPHPWSQWLGLLIKKEMGTKPETVCILAADEVVITKSGDQTHGLGKFYSSLQKQPVTGLCFLELSLINTQSRESYPLLAEQLLREAAKETAPKAVKKKTSTGKVGRPKGSKNKNHAEVELSAFLLQLQSGLRRALGLISDEIKPQYLAYDGALGNNAGLQMVKQTGLHLISKFRHDSALYFPYEGEYSGKGKPRKYGDKLTLERLKPEHLRSEKVEKDVKISVYQVQVWHKNFPDLLNVAVIVKTSLKTGRTAKVLLFSDDLTLAGEKLIEYYQLRFQIEFNFRDAKQYWGLEDFMNIKATQVSNAANFALFMVTFSQLLLPKIKGLETGSMLDLKTVFRARKYTRRIINSLGIKSEEFLIDDRLFQAAEIGRIHAKAA